MSDRPPRRLPFSQRCRNPTPRWRCVAAGAAYAIPGVLAGMLAALFLGAPAACLVAGIAIGITIGVCIECN